MKRKISKALNSSLRLYSSLALMLLLFTPSAMPRQSDDPPQPPSPSSSAAEQSSTRERLSHGAPKDQVAIDLWGEITIAQPKIWQYERVNALLDGLLRDVEGVSLADLTQLNPNSQNAAAIRFIQSALGVAVQYDQATQVNAANTLQTWQAQHDVQVNQLKQYNDYVTSLNAQRAQLADQLFAANSTIVTLQAQQAANGQLNPDQQKQLTDAQNRATTLQAQLNSVNTMISSAGTAPTLTTPPSVTSTSAPSTQSTLSSFNDVLKNLPDGVQKSLTSALQSPSYPATKQLDNFIALLHERLAREIAVQQDDLMRDPDSLAFLVQFDVGLYPSDKTKNHMARVEFQLKNCGGCKVYSVYPGQSSYNVANYQGASRRKNFFASIATLIGLGINASYQRQEDTLQGSLVQSVYISGFQDGTQDQVQRFGWYYNAAPFDRYVTPGIRSTFAIITVPRNLAKCWIQKSSGGTADSDCREGQAGGPGQTKSTADRQDHKSSSNKAQNGKEKARVKDVSLKYNADGGDTNKEAPRVVPAIAGTSDSPQLKIRPYEISLEVSADWAKRDNPLYQKSHWYVPKTYLRGKHDSQASKTLQLSLPGTENLSGLSSVLKDKQRLHVLRMEYNTVNRPPVSPSASPSPTPPPAPTPNSTPQTNVEANGCPKRECASILLSLDVPIDPNLVVTVHGAPLRRVRDWRGRATSILPPAQSTSDLAPQSGGAMQPKAENPLSRSLLETDNVEPNSWFAVTSHDLLLNLSRGLVGEDSFPVIELSVPGKNTLVIPNDLRQNVTEIIFNGFRFLPADRIPEHINRNYGNNAQPAGASAPQSQGGPFPYATFLPLFQTGRESKGFYAYVGQTGEDLIIGFLKDASEAQQPKRSFLETRTLAILEDSAIDLAWPLECHNQGTELICAMPIDAIRRGYEQVVDACQPNLCPSIQPHIQELATRMTERDSLKRPEKQQKQDKQEEQSAPLKDAFVSGLQVWVEQYDPDHINTFWSPEPAKIGLFPISADFTPPPSTGGATIVYKPWHFYASRTDNNQVALEECNYFADQEGKAVVRFLTPVDYLEKPDDTPVHSTSNRCGYIQLPSSTLANGQIVLQMKVGDDPAWTAAIPAAQLSPELKPPTVRPYLEQRTEANGGFVVNKWDVWIPVNRMYCTDRIEEFRELKDINVTIQLEGAKGFSDTVQIPLDPDIQLKAGEQKASAKPTSRAASAQSAPPPASADDYEKQCPAEWWSRQQAGQVRLRFTIPKSAAPRLPQTLHLVRQTSKGVNVRVATLENFRNLVLPSKLKVEPLGDSQFALRGHNAGAIDAVALQLGGKPHVYPAGNGGNFAVVDITPPPASKSSKPAAQKSAKQPATAKNKKDTTASAAADTGLAAGTYAVLPLIRDGNKNTYVPLEVTDESGSPLVFTKKAAATPDKPAANPDETTSITKTMTKAAAGGTAQKKQ